ncbi:MAG TPA: HupE/UreJ family protein [Steroidobacteraceae bacterium]|jgi:urease accessory protein|nr:HupE/UreJ family protein [Steroidobacteraceae bacterium]
MKPRHLLALSLCLLPTLALAHPGHDAGSGFMAGLSHPWSGMDHLITMLAVGMWGAQLGGRMRWAVPCSFVSMMIAGSLLGFSGAHIGAVEQAIAASVCILGLLLATATRVPLLAGMAITGCFAVFHGYAHATEATASSNALLYIAGFAMSTAMLHAIGFGVASLLSRHQRLVRWAGAAIAFSGVVMLLA